MASYRHVYERAKDHLFVIDGGYYEQTYSAVVT